MFGAGYALVWIGLFALSRGMLRRVVLVFSHASAVLVVVVATAAYQYFRSTGTTLDYAFVAYYLAKPGEAQGAVTSAAPLGAWLVLSAALLYALLGPMLITRGHVPGGRVRPRSPGADAGEASGRELTRGEFLVAGAGAGAGVLLLKGSLLADEAAGVPFSRAPVSNLVATEIEQSEMQAAAERSTARHPLANARLKPTPRTRRSHVALIHLESVRERSATPYEEDLETMPYLAGLAKDSLLVERAYTTIPHTSKRVTVPFRAAC